jgi:hypothetical protein
MSWLPGIKRSVEPGVQALGSDQVLLLRRTVERHVTAA